MKNNNLKDIFSRKYLEFKQFIKILKVFILCLLCGMQFTFAENSFSQYSIGDTHIILSAQATRESNGVLQDRLVTGSIKDKNGEPLIGVSIAVKGTPTGTMTDIDGNFSIRVPEGKTLEVTYMGYVTQTLNVAN
jgi:hypothetical protein